MSGEGCLSWDFHQAFMKKFPFLPHDNKFGTAKKLNFTLTAAGLTNGAKVCVQAALKYR